MNQIPDEKQAASAEKRKKKAQKNKMKNERLLNKVRKNRWWVSFLMFFIIGSLSLVIFFSLMIGFFIYALNSRVGAEYEMISAMGKTYEHASSPEEGYAYLNEEGIEYIIEDSDGNIIHIEGEDTRAPESGVLNLDEDKKIIVYPDINNKVLYLSEDNEMDFSIRFLYDDKVNESGNTGINRISDDLELPIWISSDVKDGSEKLIAKSVIIVDHKDIYIAIAIVGGFCLLVLICFIIIIINMIRGIIHRKQVNTLIFIDRITMSHNQTWFRFRGEQLLKKKRNSRYNYAILECCFVKYRNYCIAHSVEDGEMVIRSIDEIIHESLTKHELSTHNGAAHFALLLRYGSDSDLGSRVDEMIRKLENIGNNQKFAFHIGIDKLPAMTDENGRLKRREDIDIEHEYNNACAAAATLDESDDSGIAYFNEQLVEEQKWLDIVQTNQYLALEKEEFVVYYQPKYDPRTNELKGAEALIRWNSPEYGFISPGRFIPIFEKNGFITEIDHYMITHVARDQKKWLDMGFSIVPVSVNVSRAHFIESDLAEQILKMVDDAGAPHDKIEIELTESAFFDDKKAMISTIKKLKSYGFSVSMDDFGAGYSSLNSLKDMPLDVLKLDAEFFRGDDDDTDRAEIVVSEAIHLAKNLNMKTVAEGVEIKDQVDFLAKQGCDMIQGYYFAKPMPGEDYVKRMTN